jgi:hypothetical protein
MSKTVLFSVLLIALALPALADVPHDRTVFLKETCGLFMRFYYWLRTIVYILAALAFGLMSIQSSMMGVFDRGRFVSVMGALFLVSTTPLFIAFLTGGKVGSFLTCPGMTIDPGRGIIQL